MSGREHDLKALQAAIDHSNEMTGGKLQIPAEIKPQLTGGLTNYYLVHVAKPQRENQVAYTAECEDIIEALGLTFNEANMFKAIWRSANARKGNGKPDHKAKYDAEKIVHYAKRNMRQFN